MEKTFFHDRLRSLMDQYVDLIYGCTRSFPREELYGATSQLRRAALSVVLNYIEGHARGRTKVYKQFLETSFGSLKEAQYLIGFSLRQGFLSQEQHDILTKTGDEIGAMLWTTASRQ